MKWNTLQFKTHSTISFQKQNWLIFTIEHVKWKSEEFLAQVFFFCLHFYLIKKIWKRNIKARVQIRLLDSLCPSLELFFTRLLLLWFFSIKTVVLNSVIEFLSKRTKFMGIFHSFISEDDKRKSRESSIKELELFGFSINLRFENRQYLTFEEMNESSCNYLWLRRLMMISFLMSKIAIKFSY